MASLPTKNTDEFRCGVCLELYEDPRILSCLHTFCLKCLQKTAAKGAVKCPTCRGEHSLLASGVTGLLSNSKLKSEVEGHRFSERRSKSCGLCDDQQAPVIMFCVDCQQFLCQLCHSAHQRMIPFKKHVVVFPSEASFKTKPISYPCPDHPEEPLKVYCERCDEIICRDCALYSHKNHSFKPAEQAAGEIRRKLSALEAKLKGKLTDFEGYVGHIEVAEKHIAIHPDKLKAEISASFRSLTRELTKRHEDLLKEVDSKYDQFAKQLGGEKDGVGMTVCNLQASLRFASHVQHSASDLEVSVLGIKALSQMTKMSSASWNPKVLRKLGPLLFDGTSSASSSRAQNTLVECIRSIGLVQDVGKVDMEILLPKGSSPCVFKANTRFAFKVNICNASVSNHGTLFSQVKFLSTLATRTIASHVTSDHAVSFIPPEKGKYEMIVDFRLSGKTCGTAKKAVEFRSASIYMYRTTHKYAHRDYDSESDEYDDDDD